MGQITSLFAHKVASVIEPQLDRGEFLHSLGIDPAGAVDPSDMVEDKAYYEFLERIAGAEQSGHTLSLRAGNSMRCNDYGAFGLAWKSASTLRGSLKRAERYSRVLTSVTRYSLEETRGGAYAHLHREGSRDLGLRISNEASIASMFTISREVTTRLLVPLAVYFKHPAPAITRDHEAFFGCQVHFNANRDALLLSDDSLRVPNTLGDAGLVAFFDRHLDEEVARFDDEATLDRRVKKHITQALSEGVPKISLIAGQLLVSARTLQRRLSAEGHTFQGLIDEARRELSEHLLAESHHSLAEIAFLTGFSEQSAFTRAFKRWAGQTPRSYRLDAKSR